MRRANSMVDLLAFLHWAAEMLNGGGPDKREHAAVSSLHLADARQLLITEFSLP